MEANSPPAGAPLAACIALSLSVLLFGGCIAYVVFIVLFLIVDKDVCGPQSPLWTYVLMTMLFSFVASRATNNRRRDENGEEVQQTPTRKILSGSISPIFNVVYGTVVIHGGHVCPNLKETGLWIIAQMIYYSSVVVLGFLLVVLVFFLLYPPTPVPTDIEGTQQNLQRTLAALDAALNAPEAEATLPEATAIKTGNYVATEVARTDDIEMGDVAVMEAHAV